MEKELKPIFGTRPIIEALKSGEIFDKIFIQNDLNTDIIKEIKGICNKMGVTLKYVPRDKLDGFTRSNHQGVYGFLSPIEFYNLENHISSIFERGEKPFVLILDRITDVRNFGAIIRTAECVGVNTIVVPKEGTASINSDTIKTSAGALFNVPICKVSNLTDAIIFLKQSGLQVISATEKSKDSIYDIELDKEIPIAIVFGNEEKGISNQILKVSDIRAKLPILGKIQSLNVSVSVGAFCYEIIRKKIK